MKVKVSKSHWVRFISFIAVITGIAAFQFKDIRLTRSEYACQDFVMKLRCKNSEVLNIKGADFGREEDSICKSSRDHQSNETCNLLDKTNTVKTRCDGQPECFILASIHIFGNPCPGLKNYLNVMYVCVKQQHTAAPEGTSNTNVLTTRIASTATKANMVKTNSTLLNVSTTSPNITQPTSSSRVLSESTQSEPKQKEAIKTQKTIRVFDPNNLTFSTSTRTSCCIPWFFFWVSLLFIISN